VRIEWPTDPLDTRYVSCSRCGLSLTLKSRWPAMKHCPRCVARNRTLVELTSSAAPTSFSGAATPGHEPGVEL
jgi:hypothetical protein